LGEDDAVVVEERLLGGVGDLDDVADGVEGVGEILEGVAGGGPGGGEVQQPIRELVVLVSGCCAVAAIDALALGFGVVLDVVDERGPGRGVADAGFDLVEEAALVVAGFDLGEVGLGGGRDAVEGVVAAGLGEGLGLEEGCCRGVDGAGGGGGGERGPVGGGGEGLGEVALGLEGVAFEVVAFALERSGFVVMADGFSAEVVGLGGGVAFAVEGALEEGLGGGADLEVLVGGTSEGVVLGAEDLVAVVPAAEGGSVDGLEGPAGALVDVGLAEEAAGQGVGVGLAGAPEGVFDLEGASLDVELAAGLQEGGGGEPGDGEEGAAEGVEVEVGRGVGVGLGELAGSLLGGAGGGGGAGLAGCAPEVAGLGDGVVGVVGGELPRAAVDPGVGAVGEVGADETAEGVVGQDRGDAGVGELGLGLEGLAAGEVRLVLFEGSAFVVEDGAAGADPAGVAVGLLDGEDEISIGVALRGFAGLADDAPTRRCSGLRPCAPDELPPIRPRRYRACGRMGELGVGAALAALGRLAL
jgi:hypothetical protein